MVKRDKRNIGKMVVVVPHGTAMDGRVGKVRRFRGDHSKGNPFVVVQIKNLNGSWGSAYTFPGSVLEKIKCQK